MHLKRTPAIFLTGKCLGILENGAAAMVDGVAEGFR